MHPRPLPLALPRPLAALLACAALAACEEEAPGVPPPAPAASLSVSPASVDFGTRPPGSETRLELDLTNAGNAALDVSAATIEGDARTAFAVEGAPLQVLPGATGKLAVRYRPPLQPGSDAASLTLESNAAGAGSLAVALAGRAGEASCADEVLNGSETDTDCGGPACPGCAAGSRCEEAKDCARGVACVGGKCGPCARAEDCRPGQICEDGACGGCGKDADCADGSTCVTGACVACPGATGPIDTQKDPAHCGACNHVCEKPAHAAATCEAGRCGRSACEEGWFDLEPEAFGCESKCSGRSCTTDAGVTRELTNLPIPERKLSLHGPSSGSSLGARVQTSARYSNTGTLGETTPPAAGGAVRQTGTRYTHTGGINAAQR